MLWPSSTLLLSLLLAAPALCHPQSPSLNASSSTAFAPLPGNGTTLTYPGELRTLEKTIEYGLRTHFGFNSYPILRIQCSAKIFANGFSTFDEIYGLEIEVTDESRKWTDLLRTDVVFNFMWFNTDPERYRPRSSYEEPFYWRREVFNASKAMEQLAGAGVEGPFISMVMSLVDDDPTERVGTQMVYQFYPLKDDEDEREHYWGVGSTNGAVFRGWGTSWIQYPHILSSGSGMNSSYTSVEGENITEVTT